MTYFFVAWYNPAYNYFLTRYFTQGGLQFTRTTSLQLSKSYASSLMSTDQTPQNRLFVDYVRDWRLHPGVRPSLFTFLRRTFDDDILTLDRLEELQSELPRGEGKLILTIDDVAAWILQSYRHVAESLEKTLKDEREGSRKLLDYFNHQDSEMLPQGKEVTRKEFKQAVDRRAVELLSELANIDANLVARDISRVLRQHFETTHDRPVVDLLIPRGKKAECCEHVSELARIRCTKELESAVDKVVLTPTRGYGIVETGFQIVSFPWFNVYDSATTSKDADL